jgi:TetR/AcrR family transcriptional regulator, fatty acid metabolism regulator protein
MTTELSERQLEIVEAAGRILTSSGVSGLTIKNLAKEMKFSESAVYRHFTSKEEIIIAMLTFLAESIDQRLSNITGPSDPKEKFKEIFKEQFRFFNLHPHFVVAVFSDGLMEETQRINDAILNLINVKMKHLMPVIMEGQLKGVFTNALNSEELTHIIMGAFKLQMFKWRISNFQFDIKQNGETMINSILTLIKTK